MTDIALLGYVVDTTPLLRAQREMEKMVKGSKGVTTATEKMEKQWRQLGKALGLAIVGGATAAITALQMTINRMDDLSKAAQRVGLPTEQLSKLAYAADLADVSLANLEQALGLLTKSQAAALKETSKQAKVFDALNISVKNTDGTLRSSAEVLVDFADKFKAMKGSPEAMAAGFALFGRSFQQLIPLLKDGGAGIRAAGDELEAFGGVLSTEAGKKAEQFNDDLTRLKTAAKGLGMQVAEDLLPDLLRLTENLLKLSKDGDKFSETAHDIADGLRAVGTVAEFVGGYFVALKNITQGLTANLVGMQTVLSGIIDLNPARVLAGVGTIGEGYSKILDGSDPDPTPRAKAGRSRRGGGPMNYTPGVDPSDALRLALAGGGGGRKSSRATASNKAEEEAIRLAEQAAEAIREAQEAQFGWHQRILDMQATLGGPTAEVMRDYERSMMELSGQFDSGKVRLDDYAVAQELLTQIRDKDLAAIKAQKTPAQEMLESLRLETEELYLSNDELEIRNRLLTAGVTAQSVMGRQISESTKLLQEQREAMGEQVELMDSVRDAGKGLIVDLGNGVKPIDAIADAWERVRQKLLDMVAENFMDQLFGKQGNPAGGSAGGWLSALFGAFGGSSSAGMGSTGNTAITGDMSDLFGGGLALGGAMRGDRFYQVGERNRPELAHIGGKQYLIPGDHGNVEPIRGQRKSNQVTVNQVIQVQGVVDRRSASQIAQATAVQQRIATTRNS